MKTDRQAAPVAVCIIAAFLAVAGLAYILFPLGALRPDRLLALRPGNTFAEILFGQTVLVLFPTFGVLVVSAVACVFHDYTRKVSLLFWTLFVAAITLAPMAMAYALHYGK